MESLPPELREELEKAQKRMEEYMKSTTKAVEQMVDLHSKRLDSLKKQMEALKASEGDVGARAAAVSRMIAAESRSLEERKEELAKLQKSASDAPAEVAAAERAEGAAKAELEEHRAKLAKWERSTAYQMSELERGQEFYSRLGLRFERAPEGKVRLVFTAVDPSAPTKEFALTVQVSREEIYTVSNCDPPIDAMDALVADLNRTSDFSTFVQKVRAEFRSKSL